MFTRLTTRTIAATKISCVLFSFVGQSALAQDSDVIRLTSDGRFPQNEELCGLVIEQIAKLTMLKRQAGHPLSEVMSLAGETDDAFKFNNTARDMAIAAYDSPRFSTASNKTNAAADFANDWVLACYQAER